MYPEMSEFSQVDVKGVRYVLAGEYTFKFGVKTNGGAGYTEASVVAV